MGDEARDRASGTVRKRVVVSGRVQGVFFRDACRQEARAAGVAGWVGNRDDGRVEAVLEGEAAAVDRVVEWCRGGTSHADVRSVEVREEDPEGLTGFAVR